MYPGIVQLPPTAVSQVKNFQNQQNNLRFNQELMRQFTAGFPFGIHPRLFEHNRAYQQMLVARNKHSPSDGNSQPVIDAGSNDIGQKRRYIMDLLGPQHWVSLHIVRKLIMRTYIQAY